MRAPRGVIVLTSVSASATDSDLALTSSPIVRRFLVGGSSDFLISTSSLGRLRSGALESVYCFNSQKFDTSR